MGSGVELKPVLKIGHTRISSIEGIVSRLRSTCLPVGRGFVTVTQKLFYYFIKGGAL